MADMDRMERALRNAHKAGDERAARRIAGAIRAARLQQEPTYSGSILPLSRDQQGNVSFDSDAGIVGAIKRAVMLPGDVATGKVAPMSDEAIGRATELGTIATPVPAAARAAARAVPSIMHARPMAPPVPPTTAALKEAASRGYDAVRDMGVDYSAPAVREIARSVQQAMEADGILAELAPKSFSILKKLQDAPEGAVAPIAGLEAARRSLNKAGRDFNNPTEQEASRRIREGLDRFIEMADPATVVAGPATAAGKRLAEARANSAASKRSAALEKIEKKAIRRAESGNSGRNLDNSIRQRIASFLDSEKQSSGFTPKEIEALEHVVSGSRGRNVARTTGNLLGGGGGLGMYLTGASGGLAGGMMGGPVGAAVGLGLPAVGFGAKAAANALAKRDLRAATAMTRERSPLYESALEALAAPPRVSEARAALARVLMLRDQTQSR